MPSGSSDAADGDWAKADGTPSIATSKQRSGSASSGYGNRAEAAVGRVGGCAAQHRVGLRGLEPTRAFMTRLSRSSQRPSTPFSNRSPPTLRSLSCGMDVGWREPPGSRSGLTRPPV